MRFELKELARTGDTPRPVVPMRVAGSAATFDGLIDTGASGCLLAEELAGIAGIDLDNDAIDSMVRSVAGKTLGCRLATVTLSIEQVTWNTDAWFCAGWDWEHQLLGMSGFLDQFEFRLNASQGWCELA